MVGNTFYWHDYETFGIDPTLDRPAQFAGVRTDGDFNIIDAAEVVYCRLATDSLPNPDACLITGITPQLTQQQGVCEAQFIALIHEQLAKANTCTLGYNSIRFDDEVTRVCLYRNFYDPYAREWQNGNSRWDLIDVVRAARALRPDGINWPDTSPEHSGEAPRPSFRLDQLTAANGIVHEAAHDALSDVYATIAVAKLIKQAQPKLYQFLLQHRVKAEAAALLETASFKPVVHISGKYPAVKHCLAVVLPLCKHPSNNNGIIVYDLSIDPEPMLTLSVEEIKQRLFTPTHQLPENIIRIPLKTVHLNKCPVLAPISVIRPEDAKRLQIDLDLCHENIGKIKAVTGLPEKLSAVFSPLLAMEEYTDPDLAIYSGGFFVDADKQKMAKIRASSPEQLATLNFSFVDKRLPEMLFRYRARNYPETLSSHEKRAWHEFCAKRLSGELPGAGITFDKYFARLQELKRIGDADADIIDALEAYAIEKMQLLEIEPGQHSCLA
ncbi:MAG: exodeoxyribonuclease I [Methylovulum sp.]|nr:exodeoxyribonuclease I [Methylovulum sp.]